MSDPGIDGAAQDAAGCGCALHPPAPLLALEALDGIRALEPFRPGLSQVMIDTFERSAATSIAGCRLALVEGDRAAFERAAHRLMGSAASLGAPRLRELAAAAEHHARDPAGAPLPDALAALERACAHTIAAYREWLSR